MRPVVLFREFGQEARGRDAATAVGAIAGGVAGYIGARFASAGGASFSGGGFGGAVVALIQSDRVGAVIDAVNAGYRTPNGDRPTIMIEQASAGASLLT